MSHEIFLIGIHWSEKKKKNDKKRVCIPDLRTGKSSLYLNFQEEMVSVIFLNIQNKIKSTLGSGEMTQWV